MNNDFFEQYKDVVARLNILERFAGGSLPPGIVVPYAGITAPAGWLLANGSAVSRTTYAGLFSAIGTTYGAGDGSTTFNLPDMKGRVAVGKSTDTEFDTLGETGGAKTHTLTSAESGSPAHKHGAGSLSAPIYTDGSNVTIPNIYTPKTASYTTAANQTGNGLNTNCMGETANSSAVNASSAHNNLQPYITLNYIIKT